MLRSASLPSARPRMRMAEMQRSRLLAGAVRAVEDVGYTDTTVAQITARARVSRRTFYDLFGNLEECLAAVLDDVAELVEAELAEAGLQGFGWHERVRRGLWSILVFLDRDPVLARVCVVQALRGGPAVQERRERILARLAAIVDEGRLVNARAAGLTPLTAEGVVGAAFTIIHTRLLRAEHRPLSELHGELLALILLPYLGPAGARRAQARPAPGPLAPARRARAGGGGALDHLEEVPMRLTYRTARVLEGVAEHPGASNREVAGHAGITDQGQVSKLLARLQGYGLLANQGSGSSKGEPNAWTLTAKGERIAQSMRIHVPREEQSQ